MVKKSTIHHFPVGNGDTTLLKIASNNQYYYVLIDIHLCDIGDNDDKCDALGELYAQLPKDGNGRTYVDVFVLTHPDQDHIRGFEDNFHVGKPEDYKEPKEGDNGKIFIREIWSSPIVFRRRSKNHTLCDDAVAFVKEAKRRVYAYKKDQVIGSEGNRIRLIGQDEDGKTDDILDLVYDNGDEITLLNEVEIKELSAQVLGPLHDDEFENGSCPDKNRSSVIINWGIASHGYTTPTNFILLAGDAGVEVWDIMWKKYKNDTARLKYDILIAPHHCSWHTISHDSASDEKPENSDDAISALSQANQGAVIISSSNEIKDDDADPPNYQAKQAYEKILEGVSGEFSCLADHKPSNGKAPELLTFRLTNSGPQLEAISKTGSKKTSARSAITGSILTGEAFGHG